jgi:hypothetical protein
VRLASLAASLERETERLERQRLQAEKLEREMRERFSVVSEIVYFNSRRRIKRRRGLKIHREGSQSVL